MTGRALPEPEEVSPLRRLLMSSMFHLPLAGLCASILAAVILEPAYNDFEIIGGEVILVNNDPFTFFDEAGHAISLTVGNKEVIVYPQDTELEPGADGQPPFRDFSEIEAGTIVEASGTAIDGNSIAAMAVRPATAEHAAATGLEIHGDVSLVEFVFFPLTAVLITLALLVAEGISSRNWPRMVHRAMLGSLLTAVFATVALLPAGLFMGAAQLVIGDQEGFFGVEGFPGTTLVLFIACRSAAWACIGAAAGLGMNLTRSTKVELRNTVIGGALGGAFGGLFFDPIDRFVAAETWFQGAELSRVVGLIAVGLSIGVFVALVNQLAREAWVRVRTGPLSGKSFVLYRTPTLLGSSPESDIYLFKDAEIDPTHASIHRVGNRYEIEDMGSRMGTHVGGQAVRRRRLNSGDQIVLGGTVLDFEERAKQSRSRKTGAQR